jgi:hypothetical protein
MPARAPASVAAIGLGSIRHCRLRPAVNAFVYRGFFLRLPLRALAARPWPWRLLARNRAGLFALHDADHGDGGPLLEWVQRLLASAGVDDATGEIWLQAFPRVAGYVFNPVSFWFCERADGALRAIVCEVNNTFGDRHAYLLAHADGRPLRNGEALVALKRFYVSPFCAVAGTYRFRFASAPAHGDTPARCVARIDHEDDDGPLLQTSIEGRLAPLTDRALARAFLCYPAFTIGVVARIHWQALRLWIRRVPLHRRPQPPVVGVTASVDLPLSTDRSIETLPQ